MLKKILYFLWILFIGIFLIWSLASGSLQKFANTMENSTFDIRQNFILNEGVRNPSKDIVIIAIDDASYEYILDKYGEWPLKRDVYAEIVDFIESQNPKSIAFDLMFVKSIRSSEKSDEALINIFKKYDNVFTSMNLDLQPDDLRLAPILPESISVEVEDRYDNTEDYIEYTNCRTILQDILNSTSNIGMINVSRSEDGVLRKMPLFLRYKDRYYPQLGVIVAKHYLGNQNERKYIVEKNGSVKNGNIIFRPDSEGGVILNWYGGAGAFENIPMYKLLKASRGEAELDYDFTGKIVYFGATASSLFDIKTVPVDKVYPGVEVQATYVNNIIDGSLIKKASGFVNFFFALLIALLTILCVLKISSMTVALASSLTVYTIYVMFSYLIMRNNYIWIEVVYPLLFGVAAFIGAVIIKYIIKSRDFDYQYKLATTDGLTELYNHRYFQEQMQMFCSNAQRYDSAFSLIIIDIDYFKKFNDNFGHQSGDAVLRQVASTLKKNVRSSDVVCRYGGEEMSIILPNTVFDEAVNIAEKLRSMVEQKEFNLTSNRKSHVTISLGVSTYGADGVTSQELIAAADKRLYNAKNNGRNRVN